MSIVPCSGTALNIAHCTIRSAEVQAGESAGIQAEISRLLNVSEQSVHNLKIRTGNLNNGTNHFKI